MKRLKHDDKFPDRPRTNFDSTFEVKSWSTPGGTRRRSSVEQGTPSWWYGDEEASQSFFAAVGVIASG